MELGLDDKHDSVYENENDKQHNQSIYNDKHDYVCVTEEDNDKQYNQSIMINMIMIV